MKSALVVSGFAAVVALGFARPPRSAPLPRATSQVQVHCPAGSNDAFVTPQQVRIAVGDSVEWRTTGQVLSDSLVISLKDSTQAWPFSGGLPAGQSNAVTGRAGTTGTYRYVVRLLCRLPGGGNRAVVIDPDIIIE